MSVTLFAPQLVAAGTYRFSWASTEPTPLYRIYVNGFLVDTTAADERVIRVEAGDVLFLEVRDDALPCAEAYPPRATIGWYASDDGNAEVYTIQEYVSGNWSTVAIVADDGSGFFRFRTRPLEDVTAHIFRIVPATEAGNAGTPATVTIYMVRHPDPPSVGYSYSAVTGKVTLTET